MVAGTERGLLLTCLWYIREVDPQTLLLTGLTRDGVFLVENGEVTGAVNNFRFNESPVDLLGRADPGVPDRADAAPRVERLVHPRGHAGAAGARLQHEQRQPRQLTTPRMLISLADRRATCLIVDGEACSRGEPGRRSATLPIPSVPAVTRRAGKRVQFRQPAPADPWEQLTATYCTDVITLGSGTAALLHPAFG